MYKKVIAVINLTSLLVAVISFLIYALSSDYAVCKISSTVGCWGVFICICTFGIFLAEGLSEANSDSTHRLYYGYDDDGDDDDDDDDD